jgi:hypothetical protein
MPETEPSNDEVKRRNPVVRDCTGGVGTLGQSHWEGQGESIVCPVCSRPLVMEHGEAVCRSGMCHFRVVEDCC